MFPYIDIINKLLAIGTIGLQVAIVVLLLSLLFVRSHNNPVLVFFNKYGFYFGLAVALSSMALSLFYSEVVGYAACELCVIQRYFIYPQVLIFGILIWWKEKEQLINLSGLVAFFGMFVSIYHIYIENGGASNLSCSTYVEGSITCAARYIFEFGYITIPVMALTAQLFIVLLVLNHKYFSQKETKVNAFN